MIKQQNTYTSSKINADTLTPVGIFKRLEGTKKFLLESSFQHETKGKFSYVGANPYEEIIGYGTTTTVHNLETNETSTYEMHVLQYFKEHFPKIEADLPLPFSGGAIGYIGYDAIRPFTNIGAEKEDDLEMPDYHFMVYDTIIAYEHRTEAAHIIKLHTNEKTEAEIDRHIQNIEGQLKKEMTIEDPTIAPFEFTSTVEKDVFIDRVNKAKQYIEKGECEQIVLSQRMVATITDDPFSIYRKLRTANPSPYMFYIDFTDYLIIGASPESLVQTTGRTVVTNPIAGTKPRGKNEVEDAMIAYELLQDPKEVAEHDMLVQLSKRDLHPICKQGSIQVPVYKDIVKYEHVMHIVSETHGTLKDHLTSFDALVACLPAGTVSGSPKIRAMQIINELEDERRGFYAGGIGYITFNHDINIAIAIRSFIIKDEKAYVQAGAGIVQDSIAENEYMETLHKAKSLTNLKN
ncbi:anthranilate synthase component I [Pseudogracilibacillus sp. ICA-222130]|uniref:anthranilate synthase component I n=1 Tax=Pseudogracilibacillus sp. ICA-222130 TaxID=3134655 RepID=UPI0030C489D5